MQHPDLDPDGAIDRAQEFREATNAARAAALRWDEEDTSTTDPPANVRPLLDAFGQVLPALRAGRTIDRYDAGSLQLYATELVELLGGSEPNSSTRP